MDGAKTWAIDPHDTGDPISVVISSASGCISALMASDTLVTMAARSVAGMWGHSDSSKVRRAAATALSMSAVLPSGTRPATSSVVGFTTSMVSPPAGVTHSPPMNSRS